MKSLGSLRGWHAWLSVILALPILLVSVTAIFIAHDKALGLKEIPVEAKWLPGYADGNWRQSLEIRSHFVDADGSQYVGSKYGLFRVEAGSLAAIAGTEGLEVRGLHQHQGNLVLATKTGLYVAANGAANGAARKVLNMEAWSLTALPDGTLSASVRDDGIMVSSDGGLNWRRHQPVAEAVTAYARTMPERPLTLGNLVMDLHTGKAFLSKDTQWLWIDATGAVMTFLGLSGLVVWWRTRRRKAQAALAQAAAKLENHPQPQATSP